MQQRRVLGNHTNLSAQALLGHLGDVLPVDQDAPGLQVVEPQQHVDQRGLACTGRTNEADLFARLHVQVETGNHTSRLAVVEMDVLEIHFTARDAQRFGICRVHHSQRLGHGFHAVLHRTDVLEDAVDHPHDPAGHVFDADHQSRRQRDGPGSDRTLLPQPQTQPCGNRDQQSVEHGQGHVHGRGHASHLPHLVHVFAHRLGHIRLFLAGVREQLECGDIGIAVDDAAHQL